MSETSTPSIRSATSIESWLASLPREFGPYPQRNISRKRKAPSELQSRPTKQRRIPLGPSSGNVRATSHPRTPVTAASSVGEKRKKRATSHSPQDARKPAVKLQHSAPLAETQDELSTEPVKPSLPPLRPDDQPPHQLLHRPIFPTASAEDDADVQAMEEASEEALFTEEAQDGNGDTMEETPRAQRSGARAALSDVASQSSSAVSQSSSRQSGRSRASSPVKMADLRPLDIRLQHLPTVVEIQEGDELAPLRHLLQPVDNFTEFSAFLPGSGRHELQLSPELDRDYFYDLTPRREALGDALRRDEVSQIYDATVLGRTRSVSEAEWNTTVHYPLLRMALSKSAHRRRLEVHTITTAKISSSCLPTTAYTSEAPISGRHVDFAISLTSHDTLLENAYLDLLKEPSSKRRTFNQTDEATFAETPFAISIETKPFNTVRLEDGRCQLSMWALAQFRKAELLQAHRRRIAGEEVEYMPLPMLSVAGPDWRLLVAVKDRTTGSTNLYEGTTIASTDSKVGIHRIIATLHALMDWAERIYRPWFEKIVTN